MPVDLAYLYKNRIKRFLIIIICLSYSPAYGQGSYYWNQNYGTISNLLGGLVIGSVRNVSATYYNPGYLGLAEPDERARAAARPQPPAGATGSAGHARARPARCRGVARARTGGAFRPDPAGAQGSRNEELVFQFGLKLPISINSIRPGGRLHARFGPSAEPLARQRDQSVRQLFLKRLGA